jgi:hypothetical protein
MEAAGEVPTGVDLACAGDGAGTNESSSRHEIATCSTRVAHLQIRRLSASRLTAADVAAADTAAPSEVACPVRPADVEIDLLSALISPTSPT